MRTMRYTHTVEGYSKSGITSIMKKYTICSTITCSRVAQWERVGPITQRSMDRNHPLLKMIFLKILRHKYYPKEKPSYAKKLFCFHFTSFKYHTVACALMKTWNDNFGDT